MYGELISYHWSIYLNNTKKPLKMVIWKGYLWTMGKKGPAIITFVDLVCYIVRIYLAQFSLSRLSYIKILVQEKKG